MIIYNQTSNVHSSLQLEWCKWMQYTYLPSLIEKGLFSKVVFSKLVNKSDKCDDNYCTQYYFKSNALLKTYLEDYDSDFIKHQEIFFGSRILTFTTKLRVISQY